MSIILDGGWVMVVLLGLSITAFSIVIQKIIALRGAPIDDLFIQNVTSKCVTATARKSLLNEFQYINRIEHKIATFSITHHGQSPDAFTFQLEALTKPAVDHLSSYMNVLSMIATTAPVLGLLGTVLGLMDVFSVIAVEGVKQAELLSGGISKALITTVSGLSLAIPLMFIHQIISDKINKRLDYWDAIPSHILSAINK
jgi:biopolymer transport protein ExbB